MSKNNTPAKMPGGRRKIDFKMLGRVIKLLFASYPRLLPIAMCCMVLSAMVSACPAIFTQRIINIVDVALKAGHGWDVGQPLRSFHHIYHLTNTAHGVYHARLSD